MLEVAGGIILAVLFFFVGLPVLFAVLIQVAFFIADVFGFLHEFWNVIKEPFVKAYKFLNRPIF